MRRILGATAVAGLLVVLGASPAFAHSELTPKQVEAGSTVSFNLFVEDEKSDANTVKVELAFPEPMTVTQLPDAPGFTATVQGGSVGSEATGITWEGTADGDVNVPLTLGPLPDTAGPLQFKVLQTYDNGDVDRWIEDASDASAEKPGPAVEVVAAGTPTSNGSAGDEHAAEHAASGDHGNTSGAANDEHAAEHAANGDHGATAAANDSGNKSDDSNGTTVAIILIAVVVVAGGGVAFFMMRRKPGTPAA
jgi:uncharacterized protein YcnI